MEGQTDRYPLAMGLHCERAVKNAVHRRECECDHSGKLLQCTLQSSEQGQLVAAACRWTDELLTLITNWNQVVYWDCLKAVEISGAQEGLKAKK